jgi:hypothetical protein
VAGAPFATVDGNSQQGAAYVFTKPATGWASETEQAKLTASDGAGTGAFGDSVAVSGGTVVAGAQYASTPPGVFQGAAYVFGLISPTPLASGSFVIGDRNAAVGTAVTFWGSQWSTLNSLSGGPAPPPFKGFASHTPNNPPKCGDHWTTEQGASSNPPATVPQYMEVIAAGSITESGPTISGDAPEVVVVKTDPGYGPGLGNAGTGTVVAEVCRR